MRVECLSQHMLTLANYSPAKSWYSQGLSCHPVWASDLFSSFRSCSHLREVWGSTSHPFVFAALEELEIKGLALDYLVKRGMGPGTFHWRRVMAWRYPFCFCHRMVRLVADISPCVSIYLDLCMTYHDKILMPILGAGLKENRLR